ncbi:hypothetical protein Ddye_022529 [Dipteronia dyeriana]|uniref:Uncharacterized protein n=1 Tax=Dipteronia dyeriana TaxID=168575 RepID=A0AAD9TRE1_9ROSI|nr:hypothetical protein Ddye_022529 [Dipteronia dyeriana]
MIDQWIREGYSHLHLGAIRIILTLHGRKGLSVTARIALLNTIYKKYEHAVIGTCLSTLHACSISLTYYPNFNIPLRDNNLHNCLKVQLQILGAPLLPNSYMAILHHQIAYRRQDHALSLFIPSHIGDIIFITAEREDEIPTIIQNPKPLPRENLKEVFPIEWITNYEKSFQNTTLVVLLTQSMSNKKMAPYETITKSLASSSIPPKFQALMIRPVTSEDDIPIHSFQADGSPVYTDKIKGHFIWDVDPNMCDADCECRTCLKDYKTPYKSFHKPLKPNDPNSP